MKPIWCKRLKPGDFACFCSYSFHLAVFNSDLQGHTQANFVSALLRVTMSDQLDFPVRQAGKSNLYTFT